MQREKLVNDYKNMLVNQGIEVGVLNDITSLLIICLNNYEVQDRCTEVGFLDNSNEILLQNYAGTLLTEGKSQTSVKNYILMLRKFAEEVNKPFVEVNVFDIRVWLAKKQQTVSLRSCENYRAYLSSFYQWLTKEEMIVKNPMIKISPIKFEKKVRRGFTQVEIDQIRAACKTPRIRAEVELLLSSGIRLNEAVMLNRNDINFQTFEVLIRNGKGNKQRISYINDLAAVYIQKYLSTRKDDHECLFCSQMDRRISCKSIERDIQDIGKITGIDNMHPHRFRRHFATSLSRKGMDVRTIQKLMGHADINVTTQYIATDNDYVKTEYKKYN